MIKMSFCPSLKDKSYLILIVFLFVLFGLTIFFQKKINLSRGEFQEIESLDYLPSGDYLRIVTLEYKELTADLLWLKAIQFVGRSDNSKKGYGWFYRAIDRVTDLDPHFGYAYQLGGITLSVLSDHVELSNAILEKGLKNVPNDWQIPFYLGFNYLYYLKDPLKAAFYMEKASRLEGRPDYLPLLTARLYKQGGASETALLFLEGVYRDSKDEKIREAIRRRAEDILKEQRGS